MAMAAHNGKSIDTLAVYSAALVKEPPRPGSGSSLILFAASLVGFLCSAMNGYDGSLYNAMAANTAFLRYFDGSNTGIWAGIMSSMYQIGGIAALPFVGPVNDSLGRRAGMFAGAAVVIVGTVVSATVTAGNVRQFLGGRFLLGFGVSISSTAGPMYTVEVSHPAYRGIVTALLNTFWFIGSILASGTARACVRMGGTASWRAPLWMQLFFAGTICALAFFLPESPRWLYVHKRRIRAQEMLVKYHGQGNPESEWVKLQLMEYEAHLDKNGADKRWWDYRVLFRNRVARYRTFCCCCVAVFGQWAGNGNGGTKDSPGTSPAAGTATLVFIFAFGAAFSIGFTPLQALYPVEMLSFEMRAKGMAFQSLVVNAAMLLNQFAWPVSLDKIGWRTYIIFCVWCGVQGVIVYLFIPETKNCTLEEIDLIFDSTHAVQTSTQPREVAVSGRMLRSVPITDGMEERRSSIIGSKP
ncbi:hypothetical protein LOZ54_006371 [Ophidiomyces ophidiicola]|nr:hypothetical protein LOZ54_006371 [Ophidiomyces ophidiicola]